MGNAQAPSEKRDVIYASEGAGPLLQRDYIGVIEATDRTPEEVAAMVRERFPTLAPWQVAAFLRPRGAVAPLVVGDEMEIRILLSGPCRVRVVRVDKASLTLRTLEGHPEAGRITFGAERDDQGRLVFHIRSRSRANGFLTFAGYMVVGKALQTRTWKHFVRAVARASGGRLVGDVRTETCEVEERMADAEGLDAPTFACKGVD